MKRLMMSLLCVLLNVWGLSLSYAADATADHMHTGMAKMNEKLNERFEQADEDHDGTLTLEEAKQGMPRVAKNFTAIDSAASGKVSLEQIKAYLTTQLEAKQAQKSH